MYILREENTEQQTNGTPSKLLASLSFSLNLYRINSLIVPFFLLFRPTSGCVNPIHIPTPRALSHLDNHT